MPDKRIRYDTRTLFSIWLTVVVGLGLGIFTLISALNDESNSATGSVFASLGFAGALLIRAQVAFLALQAKRGKANQLMMQTMFKCSTNTQEGVVLASLRTMEAEQRKEDLLVFYALTKARRPVRLGELDDICEALLRSIFHTRVDVDIEKIVDRLEQFGLATVDSAGWIRPASLQQAVRTMQHLSAAAGAMREEDACLFVKQMLVDDKVLLGEGWGITEKTLDENNR